LYQTAQVIDVWLIFVSIGVFQLYLQFGSYGRSRYHEGLPKVLQLLTGIPALLVLVAFLFDPDLPVAQPMSRVAVVDFGGLVLFNIAGLLVLWSHVSLGDCWSGDLETKTDHNLVEAGPYRWIRHPLYSSYILLTCGLFLLSDNWWVGAAMLLYFLSVASRVATEEAMMVQRVGAAYIAYQQRTGRFIPRMPFMLPARLPAPPDLTSSPATIRLAVETPSTRV
jgi:protein-S-isoprenylcysteine O-methyltransferase Ste14